MLSSTRSDSKENTHTWCFRAVMCSGAVQFGSALTWVPTHWARVVSLREYSVNLHLPMIWSCGPNILPLSFKNSVSRHRFELKPADYRLLHNCWTMRISTGKCFHCERTQRDQTARTYTQHGKLPRPSMSSIHEAQIIKVCAKALWVPMKDRGVFLDLQSKRSFSKCKQQWTSNMRSPPSLVPKRKLCLRGPEWIGGCIGVAVTYTEIVLTTQELQLLSLTASPCAAALRGGLLLQEHVHSDFRLNEHQVEYSSKEQVYGYCNCFKTTVSISQATSWKRLISCEVE